MNELSRLLVLALLLTCNVMSGSKAIGQSLTKTLPTSLIDSMINDIDAGKVKDSIIILKDSVISEKTKQLSLTDTIIKYKDRQYWLVADRLESRTAELNLAYSDLNKANSKLTNRNKAVTILTVISGVLAAILILR